MWVADFFTARGIAVLAYDKRGVGGSTGDLTTASLDDLATDALAAVEFLRARRDIRANRIGLYGSSNGSWVAPIAATRAPDRIAFIIARSASALPQRENIIYEVEGDLRSNGYGDDVVARARELHRLDMAVVAAGGEGWGELRAALAAARNEPWFALVRLPGQIIEFNEQNRANIESFIAAERRGQIDPPALWSQIRQPVLIQIGGYDRYVPGPQSAELLRAALASNPQAQVMLYATGDHPMFDSISGYERDIPRVSLYVEGYLADLHAFTLRMAR
ncbi:MAG: alpha/beta hydrolase family protein [Vitreimonas sp.]